MVQKNVSLKKSESGDIQVILILFQLFLKAEIS